MDFLMKVKLDCRYTNGHHNKKNRLVDNYKGNFLRNISLDFQ